MEAIEKFLNSEENWREHQFRTYVDLDKIGLVWIAEIQKISLDNIVIEGMAETTLFEAKSYVSMPHAIDLLNRIMKDRTGV